MDKWKKKPVRSFLSSVPRQAKQSNATQRSLGVDVHLVIAPHHSTCNPLPNPNSSIAFQHAAAVNILRNASRIGARFRSFIFRATIRSREDVGTSTSEEAHKYRIPSDKGLYKSTTPWKVVPRWENMDRSCWRVAKKSIKTRIPKCQKAIKEWLRHIFWNLLTFRSLL